jgi:hypothetical protein
LVNSFGFGGKNIVIAVSCVDVPASRGMVHESSGAYHEPLIVSTMANASPAELTQ